MDGFEPQAKEFEFYDEASGEWSKAREEEKGRTEIYASGDQPARNLQDRGD